MCFSLVDNESDEEDSWTPSLGKQAKQASSQAQQAAADDLAGTANPLAGLQHKDPAEKQDALWAHIARKEVPRAHKQLTVFSTSKLQYCKRYSQLSAREAKRVLTGTTANGGRTRPLKEVQMKGKKMARELLMYMKGSEKKEKDIRKAAAKKEQERVKQEEEMREAKRQARKLNFLLEQTELYGHFIGSKIRSECPSFFVSLFWHLFSDLRALTTCSTSAKRRRRCSSGTRRRACAIHISRASTGVCRQNPRFDSSVH